MFSVDLFSDGDGLNGLACGGRMEVEAWSRLSRGGRIIRNWSCSWSKLGFTLAVGVMIAYWCLAWWKKDQTKVV